MQNPNAMKWIFIPFFILLLSINSIAQVNCIWVDNDPDEGPGSFPTEPTMAISGIEKSSELQSHQWLKAVAVLALKDQLYWE